MITRYSDHAANERTFLAWVRTAIALMAFGFVIERFDLFLRYATPLAAQQKIAPHGGAFANAAGLAFIAIQSAAATSIAWPDRVGTQLALLLLTMHWPRNGRSCSRRLPQPSREWRFCGILPSQPVSANLP